MKINYTKILHKNMLNVFKDVLLHIKENGLKQGHHLYIAFNTSHKKNKIPKWLIDKYPNEMTIVIQYEYWNYKLNKNSFSIGLSFEDIKTDLEISYDAIISFADPFANFGLKLLNNKIKKNSKKSNDLNLKKNKKKFDNVIEFKQIKTKT